MTREVNDFVAAEHIITYTGEETGHAVRNIAFCDTKGTAKYFVKAVNFHHVFLAALTRLSNMNDAATMRELVGDLLQSVKKE